MLQRLKRAPRAAGGKLSRLVLRLGQVAVLVTSVFGLLVILDAVLLDDENGSDAS